MEVAHGAAASGVHAELPLHLSTSQPPPPPPPPPPPLPWLLLASMTCNRITGFCLVSAWWLQLPTYPDMYPDMHAHGEVSSAQHGGAIHALGRCDIRFMSAVKSVL